MKKWNFIAIIAGFALGVFINSFIDFGWAAAVFFIFLGAIFLLSFYFKRPIIFLGIGLLLASIGLGQLRYLARDDFSKSAIFETKVNQKIILEGIIFEEPEKKENYTRIVFREEKNKNKILVYLLKYPEFKYGDKLKIEGVLKKPENFSSGGFSWPLYLSKNGIYFEIFYPRVEFISSKNGFWLKEGLFSLKSVFLSAISKPVPEPHASFLSGITIGAKESLPEEWQEKFRKTGVAHVVVLSGYNITIIAETIMLFLGFLPRYIAIGGGSIGVVLFAIMTGASATVLRASLMALLALAAKATGRIYTVSWALFLAGFFMILQNPKILRFDVSFQLSFMATLGLIYLSPFFEQKLKFIPKKFKLREIFSATIAAQIFVLPLLVFKMGELSLVSLPVNFLILPAIPLTMFFGFATGILGMINGVLSIPFGWISYALLQYELWIVDLFAKLPFASFRINGFSEIFLVLSYALIFLWLYFYKNINKKLPEEKLY